jgi:hypothetical protein
MSEIKQLTKRIKNANRQTERPGPLLQRPPEDAHHQKAANDRYLGRDQRDRVSSFRSSSERNRPGKNRKASVRNLEKRTGEKKWIKEQWLVLEKKLTKTQHSCTIGRIVHWMPLKKFSYFAAAGIAANWKKWTKQKSGELSWTSLSSTAKTLLKAEPNLDSSLSWIRGHWPRIFLIQLVRQIVAGTKSHKLGSLKLQATSCDKLTQGDMTH